MRGRFLPLILLVPLLLCGCHSKNTPTPPPATQAADANRVWRENLPELAKGHSDKVDLGWYAHLFRRRLDEPVKDFALRMHDENKRLAARLAAWTKTNHIDVKFRYPQDAQGQARKAMEDDEGDALRKSADPDFERDLLRHMVSDYDWQRHLIRVLIPEATDPELKAYLEDSLQVLNRQYAEAESLLKHYKWAD